MAWHIAALSRAKKMPKLKTMLAKKPSSARQTWQEQMAIMDMWVAATRRRAPKAKG